MTSVCSGGGPSQPKAGFQNPILFGTSAIGAFFNAIPSPWLFDYASYLGPQNIDPSDFCVVDPPADPGITALDLANALLIGNPLQVPALFKLAQLFRRYLWFQICECVSGTQPTPPSAPSEPSGAPDFNPPALSPPIPTTPCLLTTAYSGAVSAGSSVPGNTIVLPANATTVQLVVNSLSTFSGTRNTNLTMQSNWTSPSGASLLNVQETHTITPAMNAPQVFTTHIPANAGSLNYQVAGVGSGWSAAMTADHRIYCGGVSPTGTPCDQTIDISAILSLLEYLRSQIDLIQRQAVPFSHIASTVHSGLTGQGEIAVQGLLGVRIVVDNDGFGFGSEDGTPDVLFGEGWINWGNPDGFKRREYIGASPMVSLPPLAGQYTRVGYSLPPGAEITITELVREP